MQCQMAKSKIQINFKAQMLKMVWILKFDIHLIFGL